MSRAEQRELARQAAKELLAKHNPMVGPRQEGIHVPAGAMVQQTKTTLYPFAEDLEAYNRAIPNGAERLFNNFDGQAKHRQSLENRSIDSNIRQAENGQKMGFATIVFALIAATWLAFKGHDMVAATIVTVVLAGGFGVFITGKIQQIQDLRKKKEQTESARNQ